MEELELREIYTVDFLLNFLSNNYRQNAFLASAHNVDLLSLPRASEFIVDDIQSVYVHECVNPNTYTKNEAKIYRIKPAL